MKSMLPIAVDLEAGELRLGSLRVRLLPATSTPSLTSATSTDVFYLDSVRGPMVRALRFEERSLLLADAPDSEVAARVAKAALLTPDNAPDEIRVAVSLALAGGGEQAPSFLDCTRFATQQDGWDQYRVNETMALLVDRLGGGKVDQPSNNDWKQIIFEEPEPDLTRLISEMAQNLSRRAGSESARAFESETRAVTDEIKNSKGSSLSNPIRSTNSDEDLREQTAGPTTVESQPAANALSVSSIATAEQPAGGRSVLTSSPGNFPSISATVIPTATSAEGISAGVTSREVKTRQIPVQISARVLAGSRGRSVKTQSKATAVSVIRNPIENTQVVRNSTETTRVVDAPVEQPEPSVWPTGPARMTQAGLPVAVALQQPVAVTPPITFDLTKRSFPSSSTEAQTSRAAAQTAVGAESQSFSAWLAELAALLETECDMRGIDP